MSAQAMAQQHPTVHINRTFNVEREKMFDLWTRAEHLSRWFGPPGVCVEDASADLRPGGVMSLTMVMSDGDRTILKTVYREITRPSRLVFTWQWLKPACEGSQEVEEETLVTVDFIRLGADQTEVRIAHEGLPTDNARSSHASGWNGCLDSLQGILS